MTSPIKPPGGGPPKIAPTPTLDGIEKADGAGAAKGPKESFQATLDKVDNAQSVQAASPSKGAEGIAAALKAGQIDGATAVEQLVARALETPAAKELNEAGKAALEAHLREALQSDPALSELVDSLEK